MCLLKRSCDPFLCEAGPFVGAFLHCALMGSGFVVSLLVLLVRTGQCLTVELRASSGSSPAAAVLKV